jgi:arylsulfatase A-like enzyme
MAWRRMHTAAIVLLAAGWLSAERPPNVLLIISDDQGWTDFGFMGHEVIRTPHLDRLAAQSVVFPNGYVTAPLCRPSLASIMTGQYGFQTGIYCNNPPEGVLRPVTHPLIQRVPTIPRLLAEAGYRSLQTGKFWEGSHENAGFTHGMTGEGDRHGSRAGLEIGRTGLQPIYDFIESGGDAPWFVWYAPFMPHTPHDPPERILNKYISDDRDIKLSKYWAMCEWLDETCGELMDYLDSRGLAENTLIAFIVDNGWIQETGPVRRSVGWFDPRSKLSPYDAGLRTPVLVRWPGAIVPQRRDELVSAIDLAPTILRACGVRPPEVMSGVDLVQVAAGKLDLKDRPVFGEVYVHSEVELNKPTRSLVHRVVRQGEWKLILPVEPSSAAELYHITKDPMEEKNLALDHPGRVMNLTRLLDRWWKPR